MAEMDVLQSKIIQQIEAYLSEDNLKNDYNLAKYQQENNGWIPIERLNHLNKLSTYKYDTILNALTSKRSNIIELNFDKPISIRRRQQPLKDRSIEQNPYLYKTVVVSGLPRDAKYEELIEFFKHFYPIYKIKMLSSTHKNNSFSGKIHLIFEKSQDALAFVEKSELVSIIYINDYVLQLCNGYTLVCKMLVDSDDKDENDIIKQNDQLRFRNGQSFSNRLANYPPRVSFNTNASLSKHSIHSPKLQPKSCLKSNTCATEQILFCQNTTNNKLSKVYQYRNQSIVYNHFSYNYYIPNHLLKQTFQCMIIAALNPHCFTIQLKQDAIEFDKFQREMNEFYNEITDKKYFLTSEQIQMNLCVICADPKSSDKDKIWNRSQILDYDLNDNTVNLFYVDLGTWDEYVPINRLRYLIEYFHQHLVFSLTCCLAHISPINDNNDNIIWSNDATNQFLAVINQVLPEIELLTYENDGCFQTNLFVINSGQYICVNDYMIHIKKAKAIPQLTDIDRSNKLNIINNNNNLKIHPVITLYKQLGEILKRSRPLKSLIKLFPIYPQINDIIKEKFSLIFIHYQKSIFLPDFNIYTLLKMIHSNIDINIIEDYALTIQYESVHITREYNSDIFLQIDSLINLQSINSMTLYTIDFVDYILKYYHFPINHVYLILEKAKYAQRNLSDLSLWFMSDNENLISTFSLSLKNKQKRLPFSNRLISPT